MKRIVLDGTQITQPDQLHRVLIQMLELPEWYGQTLDALHDCLTSIQDVELVLLSWPEKGYLIRARQVMQDSADENPSLRIIECSADEA